MIQQSTCSNHIGNYNESACPNCALRHSGCCATSERSCLSTLFQQLSQRWRSLRFRLESTRHVWFLTQISRFPQMYTTPQRVPRNRRSHLPEHTSPTAFTVVARSAILTPFQIFQISFSHFVLAQISDSVRMATKCE